MTVHAGLIRSPQLRDRCQDHDNRRPAEPPAAQPRSRRRWDPDDLPPARPQRETGEDDEPLREQVARGMVTTIGGGQKG